MREGGVDGEQGLEDVVKGLNVVGGAGGGGVGREGVDFPVCRTVVYHTGQDLVTIG